MNIIIADDEPLALEMTCEAVREVCPKANIYPFSKPSRLLEFAKETRCKIAFLDICMRGVSGIDVAKQLKEIIPDINIIFVTGYDEYTKDAMAIHASGYIEKPVTIQLTANTIKVRNRDSSILKYTNEGMMKDNTETGMILPNTLL